ncbi:tyrosine-type recombinase/integrase, partial [Escherichia coli]
VWQNNNLIWLRKLSLIRSRSYIKKTAANHQLRRIYAKRYAEYCVLEKAMTTYNDVLFPGEDINKPISIAAANRFVNRIRGGMDLGYWRTHDFRRTLVTRLSEMNVEPHVTERMLGHELGGIMSVYNKHDWIEAQRKAYELHADKLFWHIRSISG